MWLIFTAFISLVGIGYCSYDELENELEKWQGSSLVLCNGYLMGKFSIALEGYDISIEETKIVSRPLIYDIEQGYVFDFETELPIRHRFLRFWSTSGELFEVFVVLDDNEEFDTSEMVRATQMGIEKEG